MKNPSLSHEKWTLFIALSFSRRLKEKFDIT